MFFINMLLFICSYCYNSYGYGYNGYNAKIFNQQQQQQQQQQEYKQEQKQTKELLIDMKETLSMQEYNIENVALITNSTYDEYDLVKNKKFLNKLNCQSQKELRKKRNIIEYDDTGNRIYNVGVLMASRLDSPFDLERCGPAVDLALHAINEQFLRSHNITLRKVQASYPSCSGAKAPGLAADMHFKNDVIAFIGPACAFALEPVARLAAYWNSPIITGMGDQPPSEGELTVTSGILGRIHKWKNESTGMFKDKTKYPTLTRMSYCQCRLKLVFGSIFRQFNWKHVALLIDRSDLFSLTVGKNLEYGLKQEGVLSFVRELNGNDQEPYEMYLRDASMYARVVILSVRGTLVRKFMLAAYSLGMTNGEWVFLDVEIFQSTYWGDHDWEMGDKDDARARTAYEALLRVSLLQPSSPKYQGFAESVRDMALHDYNYTFSDGEEVNFFIGAFYDGVYLLGMALNETLSEGEDIRDGIAITRRMWNRDFHGITGHVRIDDNGDRDADYSILDLDPINGKFAVVAHYYGLYRNYSEVYGKKIHWPGGREGPPKDVPPCGFLGNAPECHGNGSLSILKKKQKRYQLKKS